MRSTSEVKPARSQEAVIIKTQNISNTSVLIAAENTARGGLILHNDGGTKVYIAYAPTAHATNSFTLVILANDFFVMLEPIYSGPVSAIRTTGNTPIMVTEIIKL